MIDERQINDSSRKRYIFLFYSFLV